MNSWLNFPPFLIDVTGVANTTSTFIGVEGATKWRIKTTSTSNTAKWHPLVPFSPPNTTQCSYIHSQTHQPVVWWITDSCLLVKGRWNYLKATWALVDSDKLQKQATPKAAWETFSTNSYLLELLVNVFSYCLMRLQVSDVLILLVICK